MPKATQLGSDKPRFKPGSPTHWGTSNDQGSKDLTGRPSTYFPFWSVSGRESRIFAVRPSKPCLKLLWSLFLALGDSWPL